MRDNLGLFPAREGRLRVAAYCRVSTDGADQANSLESQRRYFEAAIRHNPLWELTAIYADSGASGTSTKKREGFLQMLQDAQGHAFDLLLTKEISRFARNTLDGIYYTRQLKEWGIGVYFLNDNIYTLDADAELRLTILASIAQEESRRTSERVKWGQKRRMEQGVVFGRSLLGYDVREGQLILNEAGAAVVRRIFQKFLDEGKGCHTIARELQEEGVPTARSASQWSAAVVRRILQNEKYCGDLVQKKTFTPNFLTHEKKYNRGEEELVVLHGHHPPIISRARFEQVQEEFARRHAGQGQRYSACYLLSGKIQCGLCGSYYVPRLRTRQDGSHRLFWRCAEAAHYGRPREVNPGRVRGCIGRQRGDEELTALAAGTLQQLSGQGMPHIPPLCEEIRRILPETPQARQLLGEIHRELCRLIACSPADGQLLRLLLNRITIYPDNRAEVWLQGFEGPWEWEEEGHPKKG